MAKNKSIEFLEQFMKVTSRPVGDYFEHTVTFDMPTAEQIRENALQMGVDPDFAVAFADATEGDAFFEIEPDLKSVKLRISKH